MARFRLQFGDANGSSAGMALIDKLAESDSYEPAETVEVHFLNALFE